MSKDNLISHRDLFNYMKSKALEYEAEISEQLTSYRENQSYYSNRDFSKGTMDDLIRSIQNSHVSYLGDFHTHDQNSRNLIRIIKTFLKNKSKFAIGLELVQIDHQSYLDAYLQGFLTELEFLESINYSESWRFPWSHYQILFDYAQKNKIPVIALNTKGDLEQRDQNASRRIIDYANKNPSIPILVLFGELHINANKLPRLVKERSKEMRIRQTIIHQNLDDPYWKIIESGKSIHNYKIIKFNDHEFCLFSSPPWMKYESMCYWYENLLGDPDFDIHEYIIEKGLKLFTEDTYENSIIVVKQVSSFLGFNGSEILEDINIYDHSNLDFIEEKIADISDKRLREIYEEKIKQNKSFHLYNTNILFCSNYSVNRLARLAGSYISHLQVAQQGFNIQKSSSEDFFIYLLYESMYSYISAKYLNPFLKCDMYLDIEMKLRKEENKVKKKIYTAALDLMKDLKKYKKRVKKLKPLEAAEVASIVGEIYGDVLFNNLEEKKLPDYPFFINSSLKLSYENFFKFLEKHILKNNLYKMRRKRFF